MVLHYQPERNFPNHVERFHKINKVIPHLHLVDSIILVQNSLIVFLGATPSSKISLLFCHDSICQHVHYVAEIY